jgi:hypothetical protein
MLPEKRIIRKKNCHKCGCEVYAQLVRDIAANGVSQVYWNCLQHNRGIDRLRKNIPHLKLKNCGIDIEKLPVMYDNSRTIRCEVCGATGVE